jgi:hypothetical protein
MLSITIFEDLDGEYAFFATNAQGDCVGRITNDLSGGCVNSPNTDPSQFERVWGGQGTILHQEDNPPNPFFVESWSEIFENPDKLPEGTKNILLDPEGAKDYAWMLENSEAKH